MILLDGIFVNRLRGYFLARNQYGCKGSAHPLLACLGVPRGRVAMSTLTSQLKKNEGLRGSQPTSLTAQRASVRDEGLLEK